ncbi:lipid IV(A) 3-deoxy-D-manno-octulosonic acid transferase [Idiomarina tyrosinivorans]|uniref:lipid IV(A) 3-deoxy-D-manno-octulosonic acid transferase n=1 Tax=Idiomarina tyrosinivorans TaxID=1445662 RepID=UPI001F544A08|nr:lipid IV(A) 3-deoxy-D-manno-octulosonic acid transferase [Idiomarina tyrosinivorans]
MATARLGGLLQLLLPLLKLMFWWRGRKDPRYRLRWHERLAKQVIPERYRGAVVVHCASVGEVLASLGLIEALLTKADAPPVIVTCMTPTGSALIQQRLAERVYHCYLPLDTPTAVGRFLQRVQPSAIWLMETEVWPSLIQRATEQQIPCLLLNARMSEKSAAGYRKARFLLGSVWQQLAWVAAQDQASAERLQGLGVKPERLTVCGQLKFDIELSNEAQQQAQAWQQQIAGRFVWVAASVHPGEFDAMITAHQQLLKQQPTALLIMVPRHPEQFPVVAELLARSGLVWQQRSQAEQMGTDSQVFLGDSMGEMLLWLQLAEVAFVGGSLIERGGHNPLEAVVCDSAVISGRSVYNFAEVYQNLQTAGGAQLLADSTELGEILCHWQQAPEQYQQQVLQARHVLNQHLGATERVLNGAMKYSSQKPTEQ